jgi:hypothetical protein
VAKIKPNNYWNNEAIGKYYLIQFYIANVNLTGFDIDPIEFPQEKNAPTRKQYQKKFIEIFETNQRYEYKKILMNLGFLKTPDFSMERNMIKEWQKMLGKLKQKKSLTKKEEKKVKSLIKTIKDEKLGIINEMPFLEAPAHCPIDYYKKLFGKINYDSELTCKIKINNFIYTTSYDEALQKIKNLFGNTTLGSVLLGIVSLSYSSKN